MPRHSNLGDRGRMGRLHTGRKKPLLRTSGKDFLSTRLLVVSTNKTGRSSARRIPNNCPYAELLVTSSRISNDRRKMCKRPVTSEMCVIQPTRFPCPASHHVTPRPCPNGVEGLGLQLIFRPLLQILNGVFPLQPIADDFS